MELSRVQILLINWISTFINEHSNPIMGYAPARHAALNDIRNCLNRNDVTARELWRNLGEAYRDNCQHLRDGIAHNNGVMIRDARLEMSDIREFEVILKALEISNDCQVSLDYLEKNPDTEDVEFTAGRRDNSSNKEKPAEDSINPEQEEERCTHREKPAEDSINPEQEEERCTHRPKPADDSVNPELLEERCTHRPKPADDTSDLELVSAIKDFIQRQSKIRSDITRVTRDMINVIQELENVKKDFQELSGRIEKYNQKTAEECKKAMDRRKYTTPVLKNLDDAMQIRKLNGIIKEQGYGMANFVQNMNIANRTFYQKVQKHLFNMAELNYLRGELSLTDEEFVKLFFT